MVLVKKSWAWCVFVGICLGSQLLWVKGRKAKLSALKTERLSCSQRSADREHRSRPTFNATDRWDFEAVNNFVALGSQGQDVLTDKIFTVAQSGSSGETVYLLADASQAVRPPSKLAVHTDAAPINPSDLNAGLTPPGSPALSPPVDEQVSANPFKAVTGFFARRDGKPGSSRSDLVGKINSLAMQSDQSFASAKVCSEQIDKLYEEIKDLIYSFQSQLQERQLEAEDFYQLAKGYIADKLDAQGQNAEVQQALSRLQVGTQSFSLDASKLDDFQKGLTELYQAAFANFAKQKYQTLLSLTQAQGKLDSLRSQVQDVNSTLVDAQVLADSQEQVDQMHKFVTALELVRDDLQAQKDKAGLQVKAAQELLANLRVAQTKMLADLKVAGFDGEFNYAALNVVGSKKGSKDSGVKAVTDMFVGWADNAKKAFAQSVSWTQSDVAKQKVAALGVVWSTVLSLLDSAWKGMLALVKALAELITQKYTAWKAVSTPQGAVVTEGSPLPPPPPGENGPIQDHLLPPPPPGAPVLLPPPSDANVAAPVQPSVEKAVPSTDWSKIAENVRKSIALCLSTIWEILQALWAAFMAAYQRFRS